MCLKSKMYYERLNDECLLQESGIYWQDKVTQNIVFHMNSKIFIKLANENEADNSDIDVKHTCRKQLWWRNQKRKKSHPQRPCYCSSPTWLPCTKPSVQSRGSPTHLERNQLPHPGMSRFPVMKEKRLSSAHVYISLLRIRIQEFTTKLDVFLLSIILKDILQNTVHTKNPCAGNIKPSRTS